MKKSFKIIQMPRSKTVTFKYNTILTPSPSIRQKISDVQTLRKVLRTIL